MYIRIVYHYALLISVMCSLTVVANVIYIATFAPMVYWIFLSNYFR